MIWGFKTREQIEIDQWDTVRIPTPDDDAPLEQVREFYALGVALNYAGRRPLALRLVRAYVETWIPGQVELPPEDSS